MSSTTSEVLASPGLEGPQAVQGATFDNAGGRLTVAAPVVSRDSISERGENRGGQLRERGRKVEQAGFACFLVSSLGSTAAGIAAVAASSPAMTGEAIAPSSVLELLLFVGVVLGCVSMYRGRQHAAQGHAEELSHRARPPVVYLRPFRTHKSFVARIGKPNPLTATGVFSKEDQLAEAVAPIGPMVAIGRPGERLPKPGAIRTYASDKEWQDVVEEWLSTAGLVVLRAGATEAVGGEISHAVATLTPERFLILMLGMKQREYDAFAQRMRAEVAIELPEFNEVRNGRKVSGLFAFGDRWEPRHLPLKARFWRTSPWKPLQRLFHQALQPIYQRFGVDWRPAPISVARIVVLAALLPFGSMLLLILALDARTALTTPSVWFMFLEVGLLALVGLRGGVRG